MVFSPCVSCSNWKVSSVSGSTFPTSLDPLCPASLSPFIRLGQMSTTSQPERDITHSWWIEGKNVEGGAHSDLGSSNVTVQCVAIVLLSMIWSNSWCSLLGLVTTTYKPYTRLTTGIIKAFTSDYAEAAPYCPPGAVSKSPQLIKPTVCSLYRQHWHGHTDQRRKIRCLYWHRCSPYECSPLVHHWCNEDPPFISRIVPQFLVEDGGWQESTCIVILYLQVPQLCVGLSVCTDNHLQDQHRGQIRLIIFLWLFQHVNRQPTLDPGCLEAAAIARRAAGPRAVVPLSDNL